MNQAIITVLNFIARQLSSTAILIPFSTWTSVLNAQNLSPRLKRWLRIFIMSLASGAAMFTPSSAQPMLKALSAFMRSTSWVLLFPLFTRSFRLRCSGNMLNRVAQRALWFLTCLSKTRSVPSMSLAFPFCFAETPITPLRSKRPQQGSARVSLRRYSRSLTTAKAIPLR